MGKIPSLSLPFSWLNILSWLSLSSQENPLTIFLALNWTNSNRVLPLLYWETGDSTPDVASAVQRGRAIPPWPLAALLLMQPRMLLALFTANGHHSCWACCPPAPQGPLPSCFTTHCNEAIPPHMQGSAFRLFELHENSSVCWAPFEQPPNDSCISHSSHVYIIHGILSGILWQIIQVINEDIKQNLPQYWPLGTPLVSCFQLDFVTLILAWAWSFS